MTYELPPRAMVQFTKIIQKLNRIQFEIISSALSNRIAEVGGRIHGTQSHVNTSPTMDQTLYTQFFSFEVPRAAAKEFENSI